MQASVNEPETLIAKIAHGQSVAPLANERLNQTRSSPPAAPPRKIAPSSCLCRSGATTLVGISVAPLAWPGFRERSHQPFPSGRFGSKDSRQGSIWRLARYRTAMLSKPTLRIPTS